MRRPGSSDVLVDIYQRCDDANRRLRNQAFFTKISIDAIHAARDNGESVTSIARRFEVHRMTVWEKTRQATVEDAS